MTRPPSVPKPERDDGRVADWLAALERRHLAGLTFQEVRRGLQALSGAYVESRAHGIEGALQGAGKRAAFALFYGTLHFLLVRHIVQTLGVEPASAPAQIMDLGCGAGGAGAAWALETGAATRIVGLEQHPWAAAETRWTYRTLGLHGVVRTGNLREARLPGKRSGLILAFTVNELGASDRAQLLGRAVSSARAGAALLVVEPISRRIAPWWDEWAEAIEREGGRADTWRFQPDLPEIVRQLDRAAGLDHRELTGRSLWIEGR